jgi:Trypsin-co-occurring domain 1
VKLSAKAGAILASADAEANYKVTLSWKSKSSSGSE